MGRGSRSNVIEFPLRRRGGLSSLRRPPRWPSDWLGAESLTVADRLRLWWGLYRARPRLHARLMRRRWGDGTAR
ncbi:MAG TPA: hypothetical protein ENK13_02925 [Thermopetrobacter sp.]|nr:hypothetical protein [Thermopetrobacter sp.]